MARLQRFDRAQEEAALDLGASYPQVFWHILLPFLKPALISAGGHRLPVVLRELQHHHLRHPRRQDAGDGAGRPGAPGHNAGAVGLAVIIIGISLAGAIIYEVLKRREERRPSAQPKPQNWPAWQKFRKHEQLRFSCSLVAIRRAPTPLKPRPALTGRENRKLS